MYFEEFQLLEDFISSIKNIKLIEPNPQYNNIGKYIHDYDLNGCKYLITENKNIDQVFYSIDENEKYYIYRLPIVRPYDILIIPFDEDMEIILNSVIYNFENKVKTDLYLNIKNSDYTDIKFKVYKTTKNKFRMYGIFLKSMLKDTLKNTLKNKHNLLFQNGLIKILKEN